MRRVVVLVFASALVMAQASPASAWSARLIPQNPPPLIGETVTIGVVADLGGKLGRDPTQLRVTNLCWPLGVYSVFLAQRSGVTWNAPSGNHVEGTVSFVLDEAAWPVDQVTGEPLSADCEAYLWRMPNDTVSKGFPLVIDRVYEYPPPPYPY